MVLGMYVHGMFIEENILKGISEIFKKHNVRIVDATQSERKHESK